MRYPSASLFQKLSIIFLAAGIALGTSTTPASAAGEQFEVGIEGDRAVALAAGVSGAEAVTFERGGDGWRGGSDATMSGRVRYAISAQGEEAAVGVPWASTLSGAVYILRQDGGAWHQEQILYPDDGMRNGGFGRAVSLDDNYLAIAAPWRDLFRGAVFLFERDGNEWKLQQILTIVGSAPDLRFGESVALDGPVLRVGDAGGTIHRFERQDGGWIARGADEGVTPARSDGPTPSLVAAVELVASEAAPASSLSTVTDAVGWVTATDGYYEKRVEIKWAPIDAAAILYKILRDGTLISVASSDDSTYNDTSGARGTTYNYCVVVVDMAGGESAPVCDDGSRVIQPPANLMASDGQYIDGVHLLWDDRSQIESGYRIRRDAVEIATVAADTRFYSDTSASPLVTYTYQVVAFDENNDESAPDSDAGFMGIVSPPLEVSATDGEFASAVRVTWVDQGNETGFVVTRVNLAVPDSSVLDTTAADVTEYFDNTAQVGVRYRYCVMAMDGLGQLSVPGCDEGGLDLAAPVNVAASDSTFDDRVQVTWEDNTGLASGYYVSRDGTPVDTVGASVRTFNDHAATPDQTHTYCVRAFNDNGGVSAESCDDGFRMIILAAFNVKASDGRFEDYTEITWESKSTTVTLFKIFRDGVFIKSVGAGTRVYRDENGTAGKVYVYGIQAVTGLLDPSTTTNDTGRRELKVPVNVIATDDEFEDRVEISWRDLSLTESGYVIYRRDTVTGVADSIGETGASATSFVDRTGTPGRAYLYGVAARDIDGEAPGESALSEEDEGVRTLREPTRVDATDGTFEGQVEITWADESNAEDGYHVYRDLVMIGSTKDNFTSFVDSSPAFGTESEYSVRAFDAFGTSKARSDVGSTMVQAPGSFNASDNYADRIELRWVDVSEVEDGYVLETYLGETFVRVDSFPAGTTFFTDVGASNNETYEYRLRAYRGAASSDTAVDTGIRSAPIPVTPLTTIDLFVEQSDPDPGYDDQFAVNVGVYGDRAIVTAREDRDVGNGSGAAYVYSRNLDGSWSQDSKIVSNDLAATDQFGASASVHGDRVAVGATFNDDEGNRSGSAYILEPDAGGVWVQRAKLLPGDGFADKRFGSAIALVGDRVLVGAYERDDTGSPPPSNVGSAYVFERNGSGVWVKTDKLLASDASHHSLFGSSVGFDGITMVVGAPRRDGAAGAIYVFTYKGAGPGWTEDAKVTNGDVGFGSWVDVSGDRIVVTSFNGTHVYRRDSGGSWIFEQTLLTPAGQSVGGSVGISDNRIVGARSGEAWLFVRDTQGVWRAEGRLAPPDGNFGGGMSISGTRVMVGERIVGGGRAYIAYLVTPPGDVAASDGSFDDRVHIQWRDLSLGEEGFVIYRDGVEYDRIGADLEFYDDFSAEPGRTYEYAVSAINASSGYESARVTDFGWQPPNGSITGRIASQTGAGVPGVTVCLEPTPTRALLLDGSGGHVGIRHDEVLNPSTNSDFTVELWFSYAGTDRAPRLLSKVGQAGAQPRPIDLGLQRTGRLFFSMSDGTNTARVMSLGGGLDDDAWHHVACVHDADSKTLSLYVDGVHQGDVSTAGLGDVTNDSDLYIGGFGDDNWFGGQIDELRIWGIARTEAEINETRMYPLIGDEEGLVGYWPFDAFTGQIVTDFAGTAQYGVFSGGVFRTDKVAPIAFCGETDGDGAFVLNRVRYAENGTDFKLRPSLSRRQFSPAVQPVTLNTQHPIENQIIFSDISSHTITGVVQFSGTNCTEPDVQIRVDGSPAGVADKNGKFSVIVSEGEHTLRALYRDYDFRAVFQGDTLDTDSITIDVSDDVADLVFLNETKLAVTGKAGGGCDRYVGEITVRFRSENNCLDTMFVANPGYAIDLPPLKYFASATVDRNTIPESLVRPDVIAFFQNLGEREVNLVAETDSTVVDDQLDFVYRAPLRVTISGFESYVDPGCTQLTLEDGTALPPGLPLVPQGTFVPLTIMVEEVYGDSVCPLDTGQVLIFDEIADRENDPDTLIVKNGEALPGDMPYKTYASTPSLIRGRTEGLLDRSYQKSLEVRTLVEGRSPTSRTQWVIVTGHVAPEGAEFVTVPTTPIPMLILRDPPGDGSYAYVKEEETICTRLEWLTWNLEAGAGIETEIKVGASTTTFAGLGAGVIAKLKANTHIKGKLLVGARLSRERTLDVCMTTTEQWQTSEEEDFIGGGADLHVGCGVSFLFSEVGVIDVENCVLKQTTSVGFEPDSIYTTYMFTERHITETLIPELESKIGYFEAHGNPDSVRVFTAMRDQWLDQVEFNRLDKIAREDTVITERLLLPDRTEIVPREVENRSFSAGTDYEYTATADTTTVITWQLSGYTKLEGLIGASTGPEDIAEFSLGFAFEANADIGTGWYSEHTDSYEQGFVLSDDDVGDAFTVDIVHSLRWGPIFDVLGGRSSCPYEPWLKLDDPTQASMVRRDNPTILIDPKERFGVSPEGTAKFKVTIGNLSDERRDYTVKLVGNSNPGGAIMRLNGAPITDEPIFFIDGLGSGINSHEATLTVERGPSRFNYPRLALVVQPICGGDAFTELADLNTIDTVYFDVSFEGCSGIRMHGPDVEPGWTYNHADSVAGTQFDIVLDGYELVIDPNIPNVLEAVGIQYRYMGIGREGPGPWVDIEEIPPGVMADISVDGSPDTIMVWQPDSLANGAYEPLKDGIYELRAYTVCSTGGRGYSNTSQGTIDRHAPVVFGTPQPADGELSLGEDISIAFNEPLDCSLVDDATITLKYLDGPSAGEMIPVTPVCNGETIVLVPQMAAAELDGRRLEASVNGVVDRVGNTMESAVTWQFDYRRSLFTWSQMRVTQSVALGDPGSVEAELVNGTDVPVDYEITATPSFLGVSFGQAAGRLAPGAGRAIVFDIDPMIGGGIQAGQVTVQAVDTAGTDTLAVATLDIVLDVSCMAPEWAINPAAYQYSMSIIARVAAEGSELTNENDFVAAFVGNQLRGIARPQDVANDTLVFLTVFSNRTDGETVRFEVWDDDRCKHYHSTAERAPFSADNVLGTTISPMVLTALDVPPGNVAQFPLNEGWNWFSTNMNSVDMSVGSVLSSLAPAEGDIIKSQTVFAVFDPDTSIGWVGSLTTLDNTSGYMIKLSEAGTVLQEGTFADPTTTSVPVDAGWNWIAYVPTDVKTVADALADLEPDLVDGDEIVKGQASFAEWNAGWFGSLTTMEPGQGYRLFLDDPDLPGTFNYPAAAAAGAYRRVSTSRAAMPQQNAAGWQVDPGRYEYNMTLVAVVESGGAGWHDSGALLGAFVGEECRGFVNLMRVPGVDRYMAFATIHSNASSGERIVFRAFDPAADQSWDVSESMDFESDRTAGTVRNPVVLTTSNVTTNGVPSRFRLAQNYPNPFNPVTTIRFELPQASHVVIKVFNIAGQEVRTIVDRGYDAGVQTIIWDAKTSSGRDAASGVYFYRIEAGSFVDMKKMVLLR